MKLPSLQQEIFQQYPSGLSASSCSVHAKPGLENDILKCHSDHASYPSPCLKSFHGSPVPMGSGNQSGRDTLFFYSRSAHSFHVSLSRTLCLPEIPTGNQIHSALGPLHICLQLHGAPPPLPGQFLSIPPNSNHIRPCLLQEVPPCTPSISAGQRI